MWEHDRASGEGVGPMDKGTGIVSSVSSDSPEDYAALRDLKNKASLRYVAQRLFNF